MEMGERLAAIPSTTILQDRLLLLPLLLRQKGRGHLQPITTATATNNYNNTTSNTATRIITTIVEQAIRSFLLS
jgi:hypothetical protein